MLFLFLIKRSSGYLTDSIQNVEREGMGQVYTQKSALLTISQRFSKNNHYLSYFN